MGVGVAAGSASQIAADLTPLSTFLRSLFATQQIVQPPYLAINLIFKPGANRKPQKKIQLQFS